MLPLVRAHLPLLLVGGSFLLLSATHCMGTEDPPSDPSKDGGGGSKPTGDATAPQCSLDFECNALPPSTCASSSELAYFTNPRCVRSICEWTRETRSCPCFNGQCSVTTTAGGTIGTGGAGGASSPADASNDHATIDPPEGGVCDVDADADGGDCPLPPSVCVDTSWLAYFVEPACSAGRCEWQVLYRKCITYCAGGKCMTNITL